MKVTVKQIRQLIKEEYASMPNEKPQNSMVEDFVSAFIESTTYEPGDHSMSDEQLESWNSQASLAADELRSLLEDAYALVDNKLENNGYKN